MRIHRFFLIGVVVALVAGALPLLAQQPSTQQPITPEPSIAEGQLMKVDTVAKTVTIRTAAEIDMTFVYNDDTKITGVDEASGLATLAGTDLKVSYTKKGQDFIASEIAVVRKPAV